MLHRHFVLIILFIKHDCLNVITNPFIHLIRDIMKINLLYLSYLCLVKYMTNLSKRFLLLTKQ